jgi:acyl dehydratase
VSTLTLAIVTGLSVPDVSQNAVANLGWDAVRLTNPVFAGDTLYAESEVLETRPSRSRPTRGLVKVRTRGFNQRGETVIEFERSILVYRRDALPSAGPDRNTERETDR